MEATRGKRSSAATSTALKNQFTRCDFLIAVMGGPYREMRVCCTPAMVNTGCKRAVSLVVRMIGHLRRSVRVSLSIGVVCNFPGTAVAHGDPLRRAVPSCRCRVLFRRFDA